MANKPEIDRVSSESNLYQMLNVQPDATDAQINKAFRNLSLQVHPDKNDNSPESQEAFKKLNNAKETLLDPEKRQNYDKQIAPGASADAVADKAQSQSAVAAITDGTNPSPTASAGAPDSTAPTSTKPKTPEKTLEVGDAPPKPTPAVSETDAKNVKKDDEKDDKKAAADSGPELPEPSKKKKGDGKEKDPMQEMLEDMQKLVQDINNKITDVAKGMAKDAWDSFKNTQPMKTLNAALDEATDFLKDKVDQKIQGVKDSAPVKAVSEAIDKMTDTLDKAFSAVMNAIPNAIYKAVHNAVTPSEDKDDKAADNTATSTPNPDDGPDNDDDDQLGDSATTEKETELAGELTSEASSVMEIGPDTDTTMKAISGVKDSVSEVEEVSDASSSIVPASDLTEEASTSMTL